MRQRNTNQPLNESGHLENQSALGDKLNKLSIGIIAILTLAGLFLGSYDCASAPTAPKQTMTLDIGIATPLTGPTADLGANMRNAALLAIKHQNDQGGVTIAGQKYTLNNIVVDSKNDAQVGKTVAEELIYSKKVKIILGLALDDAIGAQPITEQNKVLSIFLSPITPKMCTPDHPHSFYVGGEILQFYNTLTAYIAKFRREAKTVATIIPDTIDAPTFFGPAQQMCQRYGLKWLGAEKFAMGTRDFSPMITRTLAKYPDIIDTASIGGKLGGLVADITRQIREAGFKGIIMCPTGASIGPWEQIVPPQHRTNILMNVMVSQSSLLPDSLRDMARSFSEMFNKPCDHSLVPRMYTATKSLFETINGQGAMNTTAWANAFAGRRWRAIWGSETYFIGKPMYGINRTLLGYNWVSEYKDGKIETKWEVPLPMELYYAK